MTDEDQRDDIMVDGQAKALRFYTEGLGFVKKNEIPLGEHSWLTVVSPEDPHGTELSLEPDEHPAAQPFKRALVEDGIPFTSFAVDDVAAEHERLVDHGVRFTQPPSETSRARWMRTRTRPRADSTIGSECSTVPSSCSPAPRTMLGGMVFGMVTRKVTVTLEDAQLDAIRKLVNAGSASSVSGFVQHAVSVALDDVAGWGALLAEALRATGGPLTDEERAWADELLGTRGRGSAA